MNKSFGKKCINRMITAAGMVAILTFAPANAIENAVLSGLQISPSDNGAYNIVLKTNKNISFEKQITSDNKIVLDLKGIKQSEAINTIYNNTSNIDHVIFQPVSKDSLRVFIQGKNVAQSKINVDTKNLPLGLINSINAENTESSNNIAVLELNKPIDTYKPVVNIDEETETAEETNNFISYQIKQFLPAGFSFKNIFSKSNAGWLLSLVMSILFVILGLKALKPVDNNIKINLSSDLKDRELDIYKKLNSSQDLIDTGLGSNRISAKNTNVQPIANYGLKEYQSSQIDPRTRINGFSKTKNDAKVTPLTARSILNNVQTTPKTPLINKTQASGKIGANELKAAKTNIDGIKFLESMDKIYEKSGRVDLAHGLQNNIMKVKSTRHAV